MNILIIDDHGLFRAGIEKLLQSLDADATIFSASSLSNLSSLEQDLYAIDLVLLDYHIPETNPIENIASVRARFPKSKTVLVSAETSSDAIVTAIELGVSGFIPKRAEPNILIAALQLVMAGGVYLPDEVTTHYQSLAINPRHAVLPKSPAQTLTHRQKEVLQMAVNGLSNVQICQDLNITIDTVKAHLSKAYRALGVHSRTQAVIACHELEGIFKH